VEVGVKLLVAVVMIAFDSGLLDRAVHPFDLAVGPRVPDLGEAMFDAVLSTAHVEHVGDVAGSRPIGISRREGELDAIAHWEAPFREPLGPDEDKVA